MRSIGVVTVARSDYGILLPILRKIEADQDLLLHLMVSGMHLSPEFGMTAREIERDGFEIAERIEITLSSDTPEGVAKSMGLGTIGFAQAYSHSRPDILLVMGDRFEMHSAVVASLPFRIPVAHLHGGESTEGLIDEPIRHSITKMSHLHFASTDFYGGRIVQMGEEPWRVQVTGAPSLDNLAAFPVLSYEELGEHLGLDLTDPTLLVTYHPVTLEYEDTEFHLRELLEALEAVDLNIVFTYPNADTKGRLIIEIIEDYVATRERARVAVNLGTQGYFSLMSHVSAMVGNSSSGVIEAASFKLPVVNIGDRQRGRLHGKNVIDVGYHRSEIVGGIKKSVSPAFRSGLADLVNPYGDGHASDRVLHTLKETELDDRLLLKRFHDARS